MHLDKGYKYILTVLDIFSKYAWVIPLRNKTGIEITNAFQQIFKESNRTPAKLWCDKGSEFYNRTFQKFLEENKNEVTGKPIKLYSTESELKACVIERFNLTLRNMMWKRFTEIGNQKNWVKLLPELIDEYNNKYHSTIQITPIEGSKKENEKWIKENVFTEEQIQRNQNLL